MDQAKIEETVAKIAGMLALLPDADTRQAVIDRVLQAVAIGSSGRDRATLSGYMRRRAPELLAEPKTFEELRDELCKLASADVSGEDVEKYLRHAIPAWKRFGVVRELPDGRLQRV